MCMAGGFGATSMGGVGCSYHILPDCLYFYPGVRTEEGAPAACAKMAAFVREAIFGVHELLQQTAPSLQWRKMRDMKFRFLRGALIVRFIWAGLNAWLEDG